MTAVQGPETGGADLRELCERFGLEEQAVREYVGPDESVNGIGNGGSESLVLILNSQRLGETVVRKVCGEDLSSVPWNDNGEGVMLPPSAKARCQVDYLQGLPDGVKDLFPQVYDVESAITPCPVTGERKRKLIYDLSYVPGEEVSSAIATRQPEPEVVARIHHEVMRCLDERVHTEGVTDRIEDTIEVSYLTKIEDRLDLARAATPRLFSALTNGDTITINGRSMMNIQPLLEFFRQKEVMEILEPTHHSLVMGDTNTENVKITNTAVLDQAIQEGDLSFTYEDLGIKFIDPRSIGFRSTGRHTRDDRMYDNKPIHNSLGNYDHIHGEHFELLFRQTNNGAQVDLQVHDDSPYNRPYRDMDKYFKDIMKGWSSRQELGEADLHWLTRFAFIMGTHFAAMPPFHFKKSEEGVVEENPELQKRAIAVYCEGIKWLNRARKMINGQQRELFGVLVPEESVVLR